jgi:hypothetical protein
LDLSNVLDGGAILDLLRRPVVLSGRTWVPRLGFRLLGRLHLPGDRPQRVDSVIAQTDGALEYRIFLDAHRL